MDEIYGELFDWYDSVEFWLAIGWLGLWFKLVAVADAYDVLMFEGPYGAQVWWLQIWAKNMHRFTLNAKWADMNTLTIL